MSFSNLENIWKNLSDQYNSESGNDEVTMIQTMTDNNYSIDPESGYAVFSDNPTLPDVVSIESEGIINKWSDPVTFSLFAEPALLGVSPLYPKEPAVLYEGYDNLGSGESYLSTLTSNKSIFDFPQEVDFFKSYGPDGTEQGLGFSAFSEYPLSNYTHIQGNYDAPNDLTFNGAGGTHKYINTDYGNFPGPVDMFENYKANGFTLNQGSETFPVPSRFNAVEGEHPDNLTWNNSVGATLAGSLYGIPAPGPPISPQEYDGMSNIQHFGFRVNRGDNLKDSLYRNGSHIIGFGGDDWSSTTDFYTNNNITFPGPVDFFDGTNSYYPIDPNHQAVPGFINNFNKSGYEYGEDQEGNSLYIAPFVIETGTHEGYHNTQFKLDTQIEEGTDYFDDDFHGFKGFTSKMGLNNLDTQLWFYNPDAGTWAENIFTDMTSVDGESYGGPVDFFTGEHSYYPTIDPPILGFTKFFNTGGYNYGVGEKGNTHFISTVSTGTHTAYHDDGIFFSDEGPITEPDGTVLPAIGVDYFDGKSLHPASNIDGGFFIQGFNRKYDPIFPGGYSDDLPSGDSKLLGLWDQAGYPGEVLTSTWAINQYDSDNLLIPSASVISFPGVEYTEPTFPGGYSNDSEFGVTEYVQKVTQGDTVVNQVINPSPWVSNSEASYHDYYGGSEYTFQDGTNLFDNYQTTVQGGAQLSSSKALQFDGLYDNNDFRPIASENKYLGEPQPGSNINARDMFDVKSDLWNSGWRVGKNNANILFEAATLGLTDQEAFGGANEPYIVDHIGNIDESTNWDMNGFLPVNTAKKAGSRVAKFLSSNAGANFIANQNLMGGFQLYKSLYDPGSTLLQVVAPGEGLFVPLVAVTRDAGVTGQLIDLTLATTYSEYLENRSIGLQMLNIGIESSKTYAERSAENKPLGVLAQEGMAKFAQTATDWMLNLMQPNDPDQAKKGKVMQHEVAGINKDSKVSSVLNMQNAMSSNYKTNKGKGDIYTIEPISINTPKDVSVNGMPFYFRDLRDGSVIQFRAYIEGLSETISPSWNSEVYVGRSEPVYTYGSSEREINFTLKLFAQTKDELNQIWSKINRLTSLAYPQYQGTGEKTIMVQDVSGELQEVKLKDKIRMKAPLCKMRMGDLYGTTGSEMAEMTGFVKSLSYTFPDNAVWEIEDGKQVPKYVEAEIGYQVIHSTVPNLDDFSLQDGTSKESFYGIHKTLHPFANANT